MPGSGNLAITAAIGLACDGTSQQTSSEWPAIAEHSEDGRLVEVGIMEGSEGLFQYETSLPSHTLILSH